MSEQPIIIKLPGRYINLNQVKSISFDAEAEITASIDWAGLPPSLSEHLSEKDAEPLLALMDSVTTIDMSMYWEEKDFAEAELNENPGAIMGVMAENQESVLWLPE